MSFVYHTFFFNPLYNALVLFSDLLPWAGAGIIVVLLTVFVRLLIFPLSRKAVVTQIRMAEIAPEVEKIKKEYKDKPEEQARRTLDLYRKSKVNPFSGILVIFIQIPIIIALYQIFLHAGFPNIDSSLLYSFIKVPDAIDPNFLGLDLTKKSIILAFLAALTTFLQIQYSTKNLGKPKGDSFSDNLTRSMQVQMKYFFPILVFFISYKISGVIALYWLTTNLFSLVQEKFIRYRLSPSRASLPTV